MLSEKAALFSTPAAEVTSLAASEEANTRFAQEAFGTSSLAALRHKPAAELLSGVLHAKDIRFSMIVDGYFLPESPFAIYSAGRQSHVPLLAGWNADEGSYSGVLGKTDPTSANLAAQLRTLFKERANEAIHLYPASTDEQAKRSAQELSRDRGVGYAIWKWLQLQKTTAHVATYRYQFDRARPLPPGSSGNLQPRAYHSAEIEYVFSVLSHAGNSWPPEDLKISKLMSTYWANFAKTGDPNGPGLPQWPPYLGGD